jgi:hypothetical protein
LLEILANGLFSNYHTRVIFFFDLFFVGGGEAVVTRTLITALREDNYTLDCFFFVHLAEAYWSLAALVVAFFSYVPVSVDR